MSGSIVHEIFNDIIQNQDIEEEIRRAAQHFLIQQIKRLNI